MRGKSMHPLKTISLALLATAAIASAAPPRFALVRVKDIYASLPSTFVLQIEMKKERDDIMKDQRADELRKIIAELQVLQGQLADKTNPPDEESGKKLARTYEIKRQEAHTLQQEFENFKAEQEKAINKKMVANMRKSLDRITSASTKLAKERGFDSVFDSSGSTNTGVPFVLYSKNAPDLTDDVQSILKPGEPPMPVIEQTPPAAPPDKGMPPAQPATPVAPAPAPVEKPDPGAGHID